MMIFPALFVPGCKAVIVNDCAIFIHYSPISRRPPIHWVKARSKQALCTVSRLLENLSTYGREGSNGGSIGKLNADWSE